jgi:hypothetical protein
MVTGGTDSPHGLPVEHGHADRIRAALDLYLLDRTNTCSTTRYARRRTPRCSQFLAQ